MTASDLSDLIVVPAKRPLRLISLAAAIVISAATAGSSPGQGDEVSTDSDYGTGGAIQIELSNFGFRFGAHFRDAISPRASSVIEITVGPGRDGREVAFFDRFGRREVRNKANSFLFAPVQMGMQRRLFRNSIEDNFRPFVQLSAGPTAGWVYPYFEDCNGNGVRERSVDCDGNGNLEDEDILDPITAIPKGSFRLGFGASMGIGAHFGSNSLMQGLRIGVSVNYFPTGIQLLQESVRGAQHVFATPTITVSFGRLLDG